MVTIDGTEIGGATIGGQDVSEITVDGDTVWTAIPDSVTDHWPNDEGSGTTAANVEGSIDIDLIGATWQSINRHNGFASSYDGVDDEFTTASAGNFNASQHSYAMWVRFDSFDEYGFISYAADSIGINGIIDGWSLRILDSSNIAYIHAESQTTSIGITPDNFITTGKWYFIAVSADGDSGEMYIYDDTQQLFSSTGSATRGGVGQNQAIEGMFGDPSDSNRGPIKGLVGENFAARGAQLSESQFEDIWNATKP